MRKLLVFLLINTMVILSVIPAYCQSILLLKWIKGHIFKELAGPYQKNRPVEEIYLLTPTQIYLCNPTEKWIVPWGNELKYLGITPAGVMYFKQTADNGTTGIFTIFTKRRLIVETVSVTNPLNQQMEVSVDYYKVLQAMTPDKFKKNYRIK